MDEYALRKLRIVKTFLFSPLARKDLNANFSSCPSMIDAVTISNGECFQPLIIVTSTLCSFYRAEFPEIAIFRW